MISSTPNESVPQAFLYGKSDIILISNINTSRFFLYKVPMEFLSAYVATRLLRHASSFSAVSTNARRLDAV